MSDEAVRPADYADRDRIRTDTATTLFVNAGAGSGKTTALIDRIAQLVLVDRVRLRSIAAVTFTERAGAELRDRLRVRIEQTLRDPQVDASHHDLAEHALDDLDGAAIGTLHAFAQRLLMTYPIQAGLPPLIEVLDEVGSSIAFEDRWTQIQQQLLDDEAMAQPLLLGMSVGMTLKQVRSLTLLLGNDWDLIDERVLVGAAGPVPEPDLTAWRSDADHVAELATQCSNNDDKLLGRLHDLVDRLTQLDEAVDVESQLAVLVGVSRMKFSHGQQGNWAVPVAEVRAQGSELAAAAGRIIGQVLDACLRRITRWVAERVLDAAKNRRQQGQLEFHDLLVLARNLLRHNEDTRAAAHESYQRLLLDEFQDTDPIQIELAVRIAGGAAASQPRWQDVQVPAGRIFVVGDAKQSIYRFRRASIATYLDAQSRLGERASLTTNFRSVEPVLRWVNDVFGRLITPQESAQPGYDPLGQHRTQVGQGPAVTVLGADAHADLPRAAASVLREREALDVAAVIAQAVGRWQVQDERTGQWRAATHQDIAVLVPARTSLPFLEDALENIGIPYRTEASSLVYQAAEVRDLLACARALADTTDELSLVAALRSPLFGCGDDDLWRWRRGGGRFAVFPKPREDHPELGGPVGQALADLRRLAAEARWMAPSELLARIVEDRRMLELAAHGPRARDSWRRLRFVVDQARAWSEVAHGGLRSYLAWAAHQGQETSRVAESVLPETDVDAVRIMTVHAAKGLEFPIVILSGMTAQPRNSRGVRLLWPAEGGYAVRLASGVQTGDFEAAVPIDEQMDGLERLRLLYVAATRARDHLVVSLHRAAGGQTVSAARLMADAGGADAAGAVAFAPSATSDRQPPARRTVEDAPDIATWRERVQAARDRSRIPAAVSASGLEGTEPSVVLAPDDAAAGAAKGPRDLELPPWSKGRYGSDVGRAVHAVLQAVDLTGADPDEVDRAVAAQAIAEGVVAHQDLVGMLVRSALASDLVARAAVREHWRETYVGTVRDDGTVLEGYVDLIYRDDDGALVVVDYKTDAVPATAIASRVTYYQPQLDAYARCLSAATQSPIRAVLLFLHPVGAVQAEVPLDAR